MKQRKRGAICVPQQKVLVESKTQGSIALKALMREALIIVLGVAGLALSARIRLILPFTPVPFTLQTLVLFYEILALGRRAWRITATYVLLGLAGLPVFAYGGGPGYVSSPTFGYLLGFTVAAAVGGWIIGGGLLVTPRRLLTALAASITAVYALGAAYLAAWVTILSNAPLHVALAMAVAQGIAPFIALDVVKALIAAGALYATNKAATWIRYGSRR
ncbi:biotin transporter BioY [Desulfurococcus mucosus]|uniref:BioY protein n=1 Tax=Desulfurococcus mucosus (strain ATCC 35584 / DSM 2162 / JCM 9187 / O7/1) TaxID=765177 RepID=E8R8M9_DESM0|nr:biotin transporter BioY [Desulfurococcus mucosus]ADV64855.1 BioY protein [Desulfurococcus mucosus DSM 2162]